MLEIRTFVLRTETGETIEPWKGVKDLHGWEWLREAPDAVLAKDREVLQATYVDIRKDIPVYIPSQHEPIAHYDIAVFQDDSDGRIYDIAKRLADRKKVKKYDKVTLYMLGCCTIINIKKSKNKNVSQ